MATETITTLNPDTLHEPFEQLYNHGVLIPAGARFLFIAGQAGVTKDFEVPLTLEKELAQAWRNIHAVLKAADMTPDDLVQVTCYIRDPATLQAYVDSAKTYLGKRKPAMTAPIVKRLWSEKWNFEIDAVAAKVG